MQREVKALMNDVTDAAPFGSAPAGPLLSAAAVIDTQTFLRHRGYIMN